MTEHNLKVHTEKFHKMSQDKIMDSKLAKDIVFEALDKALEKRNLY